MGRDHNALQEVYCDEGKVILVATQSNIIRDMSILEKGHETGGESERKTKQQR